MLAGARVLVTGAAGFLGANVTHRLVRDGADLSVLLRPSTDPWRLRAILRDIAVLSGDLHGLPGRSDLSAFDVIFHLAGAAVDQRNRDVVNMIDTNIHGTFAVLEAAQRLGTRRVVILGSSGEYGSVLRAREDQVLQPNSEYGATKAAATLLAHAIGERTGLEVVTLRPFSVFGPYEAPYRLVPYCIARALAGEPVEVTGGTQTRDYVFVDDVVRACLAAATVRDAAGQIFNICSGVSTSVRDMVLATVAACGSSAPPRFGAIADNPTEMWTTSGDPARAARVLDWRVNVTIDEGLARTVEWFRANAR